MRCQEHALLCRTMMAVTFLTFLYRIPSCGSQSITTHPRFGALSGASVLASGGLRQSSLHSTKENIRHGLVPQSKSGVHRLMLVAADTCVHVELPTLSAGTRLVALVMWPFNVNYLECVF